MNANAEIDDEKPLDPETERVRRKLVRFGGVFMGLNLIALMAVLGAIVYKVSNYGKDDKAAETVEMSSLEAFEGMVDIPANSRVVDASLSGKHILLTLESATKAQEIWIYEITGNRVIGQLKIR